MNKRKLKKENSFDQIFDTIISESIKANSQAEFLSNKKAVRFYQYIITSQLEIKWLKEAFVKEYIPRANKLYVESRKEWQKSKNRKTIPLDENLLKETVNETIRLGYIGLFHKYESFINGLVKEMDLYFSDLWNTELTLEQYVNQKFKIKISKNWWLSSTIQRINWICNSCKHYNGKPKQPKHLDYEHLDDEKKMVFTKKEYQKDCEAVERNCEIILKFVNALASYRLCNEKDPKSNLNLEPTKKRKQLEIKHYEQIQLLIKTIKKI